MQTVFIIYSTPEMSQNSWIICELGLLFICFKTKTLRDFMVYFAFLVRTHFLRNTHL